METRDQASASDVIGRLAGRVILTSVMVLVIYIAARYAYSFGREIFYQIPMESAPGHDIEIEIEEKNGIPELLSQKGLIRNEKAFLLMTKVYGLEAVPGIYTLNTSWTTKEIIMSITEQSNAFMEEETVTPETDEENVVGGGSEEG